MKKHCLRRGCAAVGETMGLGHGFTFCAKHSEQAMKVLYPLTNRSTRSSRARRDHDGDLVCAQGHKRIGENTYGEKKYCRVCILAKKRLRHHSPEDVQTWAEASYLEWIAPVPS